MTEPVTKPATQNAAQRARMYRQRQKQAGMAAVKCYLPPDAMASLAALCEAHDLTIGEIVAKVVTGALRGEAGLPALSAVCKPR